MPSHSNEDSIILALEALKKDKTLGLRAAAKVYNVSLIMLSYRRAGRIT